MQDSSNRFRDDERIFLNNIECFISQEIDYYLNFKGFLKSPLYLTYVHLKMSVSEQVLLEVKNKYKKQGFNIEISEGEKPGGCCGEDVAYLLIVKQDIY